MARDLEKRVTDLEMRFSALEKAFHASPLPREDNKPNLSVNEFLRKKGPTTATDTVLAIAVYNKQVRGVDSFNRNDVSGLMDKTKQKKPKNINDLINRNISKGYIEEDEVGEGGKKQWYVTTSGIELVDSNFNDDKRNS